MADESGSDLDVFEGLTKKKRDSLSSEGPVSHPAPSAPATMRGGVTPSRPLPPPSKRPSSGALPKPNPPPSKRSSSAPESMPVSISSGGGLISGLPKPKPPPSKRAHDSEAPVVSIKPASVGSVFDEPSSTDGSVLPGSAVADLDWDDEEESTSVFDRSAADLFGDLAGRPRIVDADDTAKRGGIGGAAALLMGSGRPAQAIKSVPPVSSAAYSAAPALDPMPKIPAPAPVPRDMSEALRRDTPRPDARGQHPSWAPSVPPPATAPRQRSSASTILLAAIAVVVLGTAAFFYLRASSAATVVVDVSHQGNPVQAANIYIDGQKKCEFAPCKLELKPGPKEVRVVSGNLAGVQTINVEGGKDLTVAIALGVSSDIAPPVATPSSTTPDKPAELTLASGMKDPKIEIKVFLNGEDKGKLPLELKELAPGSYKLKLDGGDTYGKVEKTIELKPGEKLELKDLKLPLVKVKVSFELKTRGAKVKLVKEDDKGQKTESALGFRGTKAEETLDTSFKWTLFASLKGYDDFEKTLDFEGAEETMTFDIELNKESDKPPPVAHADPKSTGPQPPAPPPPPAGGSGFINANSIPPSKVIIDGRPHGSTPVTGVKVSVGSHTVVFRHKDLGTQSRTVTVGEGQTKTATVRFKKDEPSESGSKKKKKKKKSSD